MDHNGTFYSQRFLLNFKFVVFFKRFCGIAYKYIFYENTGYWINILLKVDINILSKLETF